MERTHGPIFACSKARMNRFVHGLIRRLKHGAGGHWLMVQGLSYPKVCNERKRAGVIWYGFHAENRSTRQGTGCGGRGCSPDTACAFSNGGRRKSHDVDGLSMAKPNRIKWLGLIAFSANDLLRQPPIGGFLAQIRTIDLKTSLSGDMTALGLITSHGRTGKFRTTPAKRLY